MSNGGFSVYVEIQRLSSNGFREAPRRPVLGQTTSNLKNSKLADAFAIDIVKTFLHQSYGGEESLNRNEPTFQSLFTVAIGIMYGNAVLMHQSVTFLNGHFASANGAGVLWIT